MMDQDRENLTTLPKRDVNAQRELILGARAEARARESARTRLTPQELVKLSRSAIAQGSKSFSFASKFFRQRDREGAWLLYSWCRLCDDSIDQSDSKESALRKLAWLESQTKIALHTNEHLLHPAFEGLRVLNRVYGLPVMLPLDLIEGMRMDVEGFRPQTLEELGKYCYHVAGVVGVMMCYVMRVKDERAHAHAIAYGNGLQMTNIVRDIADDWKLDRIYIPLEWLRELDVDADNFDQYRNAWPRLAKRLLRAGDARYDFGRTGLHYLPWRARLACRVAGRIYQEIGHEALARGVRAWDERVVVPFWKKVTLAITEITKQLFESAVRIFHRQAP